MNYVINFLSEIFDKGLQYRTLNCLRSTISAYFVHINVKSVGKHPNVCPLLTGIFKQRPAQLRYAFIWKVEIVLQYIRTHWSLNLTQSLWLRIRTNKYFISANFTKVGGKVKLL